MSRRNTAGYREAIRRNQFYSVTYQQRKADRDKRVRAAQAVNGAIARGEIVRGACAVCNATEKVEGHHEDYNKPLDVVWLCRKHHAERHKEIRASHGGGYNSKYHHLTEVPA